MTVDIIDKDGDLIYTIVFRNILISSLSEMRLSYSGTDFSEHTFSLQISYNYLDILWKIDENYIVEKNIFDTEQIHDPHDVIGLEQEMEYRKLISYERLKK